MEPNQSGPDPIYFLHIGKTGGTFLKKTLEINAPRFARPIKYLGHRKALRSSAREHGADRKIFFVVREPLERFVSGFYCRLRMGAPKYDAMWWPDEAAAFAHFESANQLAEALDSDKQRDRSAARFAMQSILHLKRNYRWHLHGVGTLKQERPNLVAILDVARLDDQIGPLMRKLGANDYELPGADWLYRGEKEEETLSERAAANLRTFWAEEFEIYRHCQAVGAELLSA